MLNFKKTKINLSEIAELTTLSRPTIYKFVDLFNEGNGLLIRHDVFLLLDFISKNSKATKKDIYVYYEKLFTKGDK